MDLAALTEMKRSVAKEYPFEEMCRRQKDVFFQSCDSMVDRNFLLPVVLSPYTNCAERCALGNMTYKYALENNVVRIFSIQDVVDNTHSALVPGASLMGLSKYLKDVGACSEERYPYKGVLSPAPLSLDPPVNRVKVRDIFYEEFSFDGVIQELETEGPVFTSIHIVPSFANFRSVIFDPPTSEYLGPRSFKSQMDKWVDTSPITRIVNGRLSDILDGVSFRTEVYNHTPEEYETIRTWKGTRHMLSVIGAQKSTRSLLVQNDMGVCWGNQGYALVDFRCFKMFYNVDDLTEVEADS